MNPAAPRKQDTAPAPVLYTAANIPGSVGDIYHWSHDTQIRRCRSATPNSGHRITRHWPTFAMSRPYQAGVFGQKKSSRSGERWPVYQTPITADGMRVPSCWRDHGVQRTCAARCRLAIHEQRSSRRRYLERQPAKRCRIRRAASAAQSALNRRRIVRSRLSRSRLCARTTRQGGL